MEVVSNQQMRDLDRQAIESIGIPSLVLMENAGRAVAEQAALLASEQSCNRLVILAGPGNNGGDGFVVGRQLLASGFEVELFLVGVQPHELSGDANKQLKIWQNLDYPITTVACEDDIQQIDFSDCLVIDALFGTGLRRELTGVYVSLITRLNDSSDGPLLVISVDMPSGISGDSGRVMGAAVHADITIALAWPKLGMFIADGPNFVGDVNVVDIGIPNHLLKESSAKLLTEESFVNFELGKQLNLKQPLSHKGNFGHALLVAGSCAHSGAAVLAANATMRAGAGLVTLATPKAAHDFIKPQLVEPMSTILPAGSGENQDELTIECLPALQQALHGKQVCAIGPGLAGHDGLLALFEALLKTTKVPMVIDAAGINVVAKLIEGQPHLLRSLATPLVLTPHSGEMARLLGSTAADVQADRYDLAREFAITHGVCLVLKGQRTLVCSASGDIAINTTGSSVLSSAGMGDVLTGMLSAYIAQGLDVFTAAQLAVYHHGVLADELIISGERNLIASDMLLALAGRETYAL